MKELQNYPRLTECNYVLPHSTCDCL